MSKHIFRLALVLFLVFIPNAALAQEQIQAPVFKEGDFWQYKITDKAGNGMTVARGIIPEGVYVFRASTASNGRFQVSQITGNEEVILERPGMLYFLMGRRSRTANASQSSNSQELNFPLFVGKKWEYAYDLDLTRGTRHRMVAIQIVGREQIETPAGKFDAFKLEKTIFWPSASALWGTFVNDVQAVYFYGSESSDGARRNIELLKYIPAN
jgi:hypothetical protein